MNFTFRPARRSEAKPLIGLYSESGCGKTYSSLLLVRGFVGQMGKIGMIETESGRGEAYADLIPGGYTVLPIRENFSPEIYGNAIAAAEAAGLDALIIDSASHEWEGVGGVLDMAAQNQAAGKKGPLVWQKPKIDHQKHFMLRLMQTPIKIVIVCMRAKYPMEENKQTRQWTRSLKLEAKQSEDIMFEMFLHGWIDSDHKFRATKYTRPDLAQVIKDGERISIDTGKALAEWASPHRMNNPNGVAPLAPVVKPEAPVGDPDFPTDRDDILSDVLIAIDMAEDEDELKTVAASAAKLPADDKAKATAAYKKKLAEIRNKEATNVEA